MTVGVLLTSLGIVLARIVDVSLGTVRTIYLVRGDGGRAALLGFFEVLVGNRVLLVLVQLIDLDVDFLQVGWSRHASQTHSRTRFIDDVEFLIDEDEELVHFRSASRVGRSDLGVNRKRMSKIVDKLASGG